MKAAVIYYSKSGTTRKIADAVAAKFHADVFPVEPVKPYGGFVSSVIRAMKEIQARKPAELKTQPGDFTAYDVIFVGFPVWAGTVPTFEQVYLRDSKFGEQVVIPFATANGTGRDTALATINRLFPRAKVCHYFFSSKAKEGDVNAWLKEVATDASIRK